MKNKLFGHSSIYALSNIIRQLVGFIMLPVYTTYLTPADYGAVALISFAIIISEAIFGARLMDAVPRFYHDKSLASVKNKVVSTALWITSIASFLIVLAMVMNRDVISVFLFSSSAYSLAFALFATQTLTQAIEYYGLLYIRIQEKPWLFLFLNIAKLAVQLGMNIWLVVYMEMGVLGVAISGLVATSIFAVFSAIYCISHCGAKFDKAIGVKMLLFSWPLWLTGLVALYLNSSNRYYIKIFSSISDVGIYDLAERFAMIMLVVIWVPFSQYWSNERYKVYSQENKDIVFSSVYKIVCSLLGIAAVGVSILSVPVIEIMADKSFHVASSLVPIVIIGFFIRSIAEFLQFGFMIDNKTIYIAYSSYISAAIITILFFVLIPIMGLVGAAYAFLITQIFQFFYAYYKNKSKIRINNAVIYPVFVLSVVVITVTGCERLILYIDQDIGFFGELLLRLLFCAVAVVLLQYENLKILVTKKGLSGFKEKTLWRI